MSLPEEFKFRLIVNNDKVSFLARWAYKQFGESNSNYDNFILFGDNLAISLDISSNIYTNKWTVLFKNEEDLFLYLLSV